MTATDVGRLGDAAARAADVIVENAVTSHGRAAWLGATAAWADGDVAVVSRSGEASLYDGSAGVALAAWHAAGALGRDDLRETAVCAARHAVSARSRLAGAGLFDGMAGVALAALDVGAAAGEPELGRAGRDTLASVAGLEPSGPDLVSGAAGTVIALLAAARLEGSDRWLAAATRHGDALLAMAERRAWGWGWAPAGQAGHDRPPLCGLAHGGAGVTWALGELAAVTGEARFATAVEAGRRYERAWFDPSTNTWPDLRGAADSPARAAPPARPSLWCHGGVGIGLARLALYRLDPEPWLAAEAAAALQSSTAAASTALRAGDAESGLTLCHGLGGTVLLLLAAARSYGENEHLDAARWLAARVLDLLGPDPPAWPSGVRGGAFTPGLMTGLAGALYVLARAAEPCEVAPLSVLGER